MTLLVKFEPHVVFEDGSVGIRHLGSQQLIYGLPNDMIDIEFGTEPGTYFEHSCQTRQKGLQEGVNGHDLHVVVIEQHAFETGSCTLAQYGIGGIGIAHHELPCAGKKRRLFTLRDTVEVTDDTLTHLGGRFVGERDSKDRTVVFAGQ